MPRMTVNQIDDMRRQGSISWEDYAQLLKGHSEWSKLIKEFPFKRNRQGRLRELLDLGGPKEGKEE